MPFPAQWGPYPFSISSDKILRLVTLTQTTGSCPSVPTGTPYTVLVARDDGSKPTDRGKVMLDDNGVIQGFCNLIGNKIGGHLWKKMTGQFNADGSESDGDWGDDSEPNIVISGTWAAGGGGEPFGQHREHKHGQHA
jgi:hypothetical protein